MNSSVLDFLYIRIIQCRVVVSLVSGQSGRGQLPWGRAVRYDLALQSWGVGGCAVLRACAGAS